jgi:two-component system LytT family response regulator
VDHDRLKATIDRARKAGTVGERTAGLTAAATALDIVNRRHYLERIPVKKRDETVLLPVRQIASIVAERELLHLTTVNNERYTIAHRLHALEERLDPRRFVRLGRGALAAVDSIQKFSPMPGGTYEVQLSNGQTLIASRIQSRVLRETLLRL